MKKLMLFITYLIISISLVGCNNMHSEQSLNTSIKNDEINFVEMDYYKIDFEKIEFPFNLSNMDFVNNKTPIYKKEDAIKIGNVILEEWHSQGICKDKVLLSILHSKQDNIWLLYYSIPRETTSDDKLIIHLDDSLNVAIDGNSGEIIIAWAEEG